MQVIGIGLPLANWRGEFLPAAQATKLNWGLTCSHLRSLLLFSVPDLQLPALLCPVPVEGLDRLLNPRLPINLNYFFLHLHLRPVRLLYTIRRLSTPLSQTTVARHNPSSSFRAYVDLGPILDLD